jgi:hypothetical protein
MSAVTIERDRTISAGHALIRVHGGARARANPGFRLHRQAEWGDATLGPAGWQVAEELLTPARVTIEGEDLVLGVGPEVCSHVESGVYRIVVPAAGVDAVVVWPEIATLHTGRGGAFADPNERTVEPRNDAQPKNSIEPENEAVPEKGTKPEKGAESVAAKDLGIRDRVAWGFLFGLIAFIALTAVAAINAHHTDSSSHGVDLPQESWNRHDLDMLVGCWRSITQLRTRDVGTNVIYDVRQWQLCFDRSGNGRQTVLWTDGASCQGPMKAIFSDDSHLVITDSARCFGPRRPLYLGRFECERISDSEATCTRMNTEGPEQWSRDSGRFMR